MGPGNRKNCLVSDEVSIPNSAYRAHRPVQTGMEPGTKRLLIIAGGLGGILVAVIAASALMGRSTPTEVPVVQADSRPMRVKPENPGGMQVVGAGAEIFSGGGDNTVTRLAPAAEAPDPKGLRSEPAKKVAPAAHDAAKAPHAAPLLPVPDETAAHPAAAGTPAPGAAPGAAPNAAPGAAPNAARLAARPDAPHAVASAPAPTPPKPAAAQPAKPVAPVQMAVVSPPPAPAAVAPQTEKRPAAGGKAIVQLAALSTEEAARTEWQALVKRMPDLLTGRQPVFVKTERDGRTFWRVRTTGFGDVNDAKAFCEKVRAKGGGCTVAEF